jgi:hypothetical protein
VKNVELNYAHVSINYYPIMTLQKLRFGALASMILSPILAAGNPSIKTVLLPFRTLPPTCGFPAGSVRGHA